MNEDKYKVLIVDDHPDSPDLVKIYSEAISGEEKNNYDQIPHVIKKPEEVTCEVIKNAHILLLDWEFDNSEYNGDHVLRQIEFWRKRGEDIRTKIIILSELRSFFEYWKNSQKPVSELAAIGVTDVSVKWVVEENPFVLKWQMDKALNIIKARERIHYLTEHLEPDFIRQSAAMKALFEYIVKIAPGNSNVLITGESGTGKGVVAKAIRNLSRRKNGPFVTINCASIPNELVESELFGHVKGGFTGAVTDKKGRFEVASGGTLFLDEIGELSWASQAKLLRAIQEMKIIKVGGTMELPVDVRLITATNQNLNEKVREKAFREDLFYRINVVPIHLPPLRERVEDIPPLVEYLIQNIRERGSIPNAASINNISSDASNSLKKYDWPGNVRELSNVLERAINLAAAEKTHTLKLEHVEIQNSSTAIRRTKRRAFNDENDLDFEEAAKDLIDDHLQAITKCREVYTQADLNFFEEKFTANLKKSFQDLDRWEGIREAYLKNRSVSIKPKHIKGRHMRWPVPFTRHPLREEKMEIFNMVGKLLQDRGRPADRKDIVFVLGLRYGDYTSVKGPSRKASIDP